MPKFTYTVVNKENQQLNGSINATDIKQARDELNNLGLSVITIEEIQDAQKPLDEVTGDSYDFEALDKTGRKVSGRIKDEDYYHAFVRLRTEYNFDVINLYREGATPEEQATAKTKTLPEFTERFQQEFGEINNTAALGDAFEKQREYLEHQVEFVLKKVEDYLQKFAGEVKPEEEKKLREQMDKIKLVKTSTNLEHVQQLCQELLEKVQERSIYLNQEKYLKEKTAVAIEAKQMITSINKKPQAAAATNITIDPNSSLGKISQTLTDKFHEIFKQDPKIISIKEQIRGVNTNIIEYLKLYFQSNHPEEKAEIKTRLTKLYEHRKSLKAQLKEVKHGVSAATPDSTFSTANFVKSAHGLTGWLLTFYLIYYFIGLYISTKQIAFETIPAGLLMYDTAVFKYLLPIVLIIHIAAGIIKFFFKKQLIALSVSIPIIIISSILIIFNF